ncbi:hypothetical protein KC360_g8725 [Hortaea werneckii]|nr:hypothetical protein KC361_g4616 [Hortaea werneckii]KAI6878289.1 hypothetical protein KC325_g8718 [Hortaea werneckii]KAI6986200.1 hypothetical protein KC359_g8857 [Hortaea werneckii]KAI7140422.1 hypothetical protein KC344_g8729 [Hortaea werneckii]KAI7167330.1 hypothetical protein KC360_g8725 [Hortaea werneckii]
MAAQADPNTSSRAVFTEVLINNPIPDHACDAWKNQMKSLKELYQLLANHPGMSRNNEQVFAQPAHEKNTVYFMWDFVGRTITMAYMIDPSLPTKPDVQERWGDIMSRSVMAANLLLDQPPGMLDQMVTMSYPNQSGEKPVIGNDIKDAARKLM